MSDLKVRTAKDVSQLSQLSKREFLEEYHKVYDDSIKLLFKMIKLSTEEQEALKETEMELKMYSDFGRKKGWLD